MWLIYLVVNNFAVAILIFTIIIKFATFPLNLKQQKNTAISQLFTPKVREIQQKYRNNPQKQQEEMVKLQKQGYNPTGGCGTMLLTFLILFGVIDVVYKPMTHMEHIDSGSIKSIVQLAKQAEITSVLLSNDGDKQVVLDFIDEKTAIITVDKPQVVLEKEFDAVKQGKPINELTYEELMQYANFTDTDLVTLSDTNSRLSNQVKSQITLIRSNYMEGNLYSELRALKVFTQNPDLFKKVTSQENIDKLDKLSENMVFMGIDLGETPTLELNALIIIPILSLLFNLLQVFVQQYYQKKNSPELAAQMGGGMKLFMYSMPLLSLYISFVVPSGVGLYWAISAAIAIIQTIITNKIWPHEKIREEARAKMEAAAAKNETRTTVIKIDENGNEVQTTARLSELSQKELKEYQRKKLEEARRADAEKYGEEYIESDED